MVPSRDRTETEVAEPSDTLARQHPLRRSAQVQAHLSVLIHRECPRSGVPSDPGGPYTPGNTHHDRRHQSERHLTAGSEIDPLEPQSRGAARADGGDAQRPVDRVRQLQRRYQGRGPKQGEHLRGDRPPREPLRPDHPPGRGRAHRRHPGRVHRRPGHAGDRRLHRQRSRPPGRRPAVHRGGQRQHRGDAAGALLRRRGRRPRLPAPADGHLHTQPPGPRLSQRSGDRRRPRRRGHPGAQLRLLRRVEEGRPADVERAHLRARRPGHARRLQGGPDRARRAVDAHRRAQRHRQDHHHLHPPEQQPAGAGRLRRPLPGRPHRQLPRTAASPRPSRSTPGTSPPSTARSPGRRPTWRTSPRTTAASATSSTPPTPRTAAPCSAWTPWGSPATRARSPGSTSC